MPPPNLLTQKWFSGMTLQAASKVLWGNADGLPEMEKRFLGNLFWHYLDPSKNNVGELDDMIAFFSFAFLNRRRSRAQILQDLWVLFQSREKHGGYFVEFGACDGLSLSNTFLLEKEYGWTGILAEPAPDMWEGNEKIGVRLASWHRSPKSGCVLYDNFGMTNHYLVK